MALRFRREQTRSHPRRGWRLDWGDGVACAHGQELSRIGELDRALELACDFGWIQKALFAGVETESLRASEETLSTRRERFGWFVDTLYLLLGSASTQNRESGSRVAALLRAIRAFTEALIEDGDQLLFQLLANGEGGPEWREVARSWLPAQTGLSWVGWLELVSGVPPPGFVSSDASSSAVRSGSSPSGVCF
jgi:hypothetical protein